MTQVRELYGNRLRDPAAVLELVIALADPRAAHARHDPESRG